LNKSQQSKNGYKTEASSGSKSIRKLIADLTSKDKDKRVRAHDSLVAIGDSATIYLVEALASSNSHLRWEAMKTLDDMEVDWKHHTDEATIRSLVIDLGSKDGLVRVRARRAIVTIGSKAIPALEEALKSENQWLRWEAAKALGQIGDPAAVQALIKALEDVMFDVRWLAAEGLITIGIQALKPLMQQLAQNSDSLWLREGVHHILHDIHKKDIQSATQPVLQALEDVEAPLEVPFAVESALKSLAKVQ
jgi:HEAT repeat protein